MCSYNKLFNCLLITFGVSFCPNIVSKVMTDMTDGKICSDHPEELIKSGGACKSFALIVQEISSPVYRAIESCLDASKNIENNEFLIDWKTGSSHAKAHVYTNDFHYWIGFYVQDDAGGGFACLVEKKVNRVVWTESYH